MLTRLVLLWFFVLLFAIAGVLHLAKPALFVATIPFLPWPKLVVYASGVIELLLAVGLCLKHLRKRTLLAAIVFLVTVFPANIYMAFAAQNFASISEAVLWLRLLLQPLFIAALYWLYKREHP